ncbi:exosortase Q [Corticibacter populi]|nr:exosortase Q [Corticibacter populi]RZS32048.1 exosortase/archaeosortase family protein [Corticibacter populi]
MAWGLALLAAALWPQALWMLARLRDGSDEPLGILALLALLWLGLAQRQPWRRQADARWLMAGALLTLLAMLAHAHGPALLSALLAMLAVTACLLSVRPVKLASAPLLGLAVLSLPLLASLQFYLGYPLRVLVAEASRWLLSSQHVVARSGASLLVDGQLVLVDAACSGVQMAWWGYFVACLAALHAGAGNRRFLRRLPLVGALVLAGNIVRNTVLVAWQSQGEPLAPFWHEGIGLAVLLLVCAAVWRLMQPSSAASLAHRPVLTASAPTVLPPRRAATALWLLAGLCAAWQLMAAAPGPFAQDGHPSRPSAHAAVEWPVDWQGRPLRPLALGEIEARFAAQFPGRIERLSTGREVLVWRYVLRPTRMLHPAADCFRGIGYRVHGERLEQQAGGHTWRCFIAERNGEKLRVCERIEDAAGHGFTDTSAWYWAALLDQTQGPWQAVTVVSPL